MISSHPHDDAYRSGGDSSDGAQLRNSRGEPIPDPIDLLSSEVARLINLGRTYVDLYKDYYGASARQMALYAGLGVVGLFAAVFIVVAAVFAMVFGLAGLVASWLAVSNGAGLFLVGLSILALVGIGILFAFEVSRAKAVSRALMRVHEVNDFPSVQ